MTISFWKGGVHPPEMKLTSGMPIVDVQLPMKAVVSLSQSLGKPAKEIVAKGQHVSRYEKIGEAQGPISANVHSPISGTVKEISQVAGTDGHYMTAITIEASEEDHAADLQMIADAKPLLSNSDIDRLTSEEIIEKVREAGVVGLGGATFPVAVKIAPSKAGVAETLLINGAECEPYLTCDEAIMREMPDEIIQGINILMKGANVKKAIVGIEKNKPEAIAKMTAAARPYPEIEVVGLNVRYPQGGEKMLTKALTGREIGSGQLPITQGVIIQNVATALAVYHAVVWGIPLVERVMTVSGKDYEGRGNYRLPVGVAMKDFVGSIGEVPASTVKIVAGGTMMGRSMADINGYSTKGTSGLLFLSESETNLEKPVACVKCAKCVSACPIGLEPNKLARLSELGKWEEAKANHILDCMECGCCSFSCISRRKIVDWIRVGKAAIRELRI